MSALSLEKNGRISSSKWIKHIKAKNFLIKDYYNTGEMCYCHTDVMWAGIITKPLQGQRFRGLHAFLQNSPRDYDYNIELQMNWLKDWWVNKPGLLLHFRSVMVNRQTWHKKKWGLREVTVPHVCLRCEVNSGILRTSMQEFINCKNQVSRGYLLEAVGGRRGGKIGGKLCLGFKFLGGLDLSFSHFWVLLTAFDQILDVPFPIAVLLSPPPLSRVITYDRCNLQNLETLVCFITWEWRRK